MRQEAAKIAVRRISGAKSANESRGNCHSGLTRFVRCGSLGGEELAERGPRELTKSETSLVSGGVGRELPSLLHIPGTSTLIEYLEDNGESIINNGLKTVAHFD